MNEFDNQIDTLVDELIRDEDIVLYVYDDETGRPIQQGSVVQGHPTIGVGRRVDKLVGISEGEAFFLLENNIEEIEADLDANLPWWRNLSGPQQRGLANMRFNLGMAGLLEFRNMLSALREGDLLRVEKEARDSLWAKQVPNRAERVISLLKST